MGSSPGELARRTKKLGNVMKIIMTRTLLLVLRPSKLRALTGAGRWNGPDATANSELFEDGVVKVDG